MARPFVRMPSTLEAIFCAVLSAGLALQKFSEQIREGDNNSQLLNRLDWAGQTHREHVLLLENPCYQSTSLP